jgi:hypothetical protein
VNRLVDEFTTIIEPRQGSVVLAGGCLIGNLALEMPGTTSAARMKAGASCSA